MYSANKIVRTISLIGAFAFFTLSPAARAVDPPPDGGYPNQNTAEGDSALFSLTTGSNNTAIGYTALFSNTDGPRNTAIGSASLYSNTTGYNNTANGNNALYSNTTGGNNTAIGESALSSNTFGAGNTASGFDALATNTTGNLNTASGLNALANNTTGVQNTANGEQALALNTTGSNNTASGVNALFGNTTGGGNIALGVDAGRDLTTGNDNIYIGNTGIASESGTIRIGTAGTQTATFIAGIREVPLCHGLSLAVGITADGQLGVRASSARFKSEIKPMDKASEAILSLQPVTFRYKKALDPKGIPQFGLVAEDVAKVAPDLVARDADGKPFTVRYEEVNAMLLNEFLKEHRKVTEQGEEITALKRTVAELKTTIEKVSARQEAQEPAARLVENR